MLAPTRLREELRIRLGNGASDLPLLIHEQHERGLQPAESVRRAGHEYYLDYTADRNSRYGIAGAQMPRRYVAEMIFDRVSASRVYKGENYTDDAPLQYFLASKDRSWYVNDVTKRQMEFLLRMWAVKGEDYTIRYIRDVFLRGRNRYR